MTDGDVCVCVGGGGGGVAGLCPSSNKKGVDQVRPTAEVCGREREHSVCWLAAYVQETCSVYPRDGSD